jgi:hypothetical protein
MKIALVLGGADCVFDDIAAFRAFGVEPDIVTGCNDVIARWEGHLSAACTLHPSRFDRWLRERAEAGLSAPGFAYVDECKGDKWGFDETPYKFEGQKSSGSSGLYALIFALVDLGADRAVICGIPMENRPHFHGPAPWGGYRFHRRGWSDALPQIKDRARSLSGWTREILGAPDREWLQ